MERGDGFNRFHKHAKSSSGKLFPTQNNPLKIYNFFIFIFWIFYDASKCHSYVLNHSRRDKLIIVFDGNIVRVFKIDREMLHA